jgi:hypothetical protein
VDGNGTAGSRGATTGFNGIEIFEGWNGPQMLIQGNWFFRGTTNGVYVGNTVVNVSVTGNYFYDNFLAMTVSGTSTVTLQGNLIELPLTQGAEEGILIVGPGPVVSVGGPGVQNTFRNFIGTDSPAIHCGTSVSVTCPAGGNVWDNVTVHVQGCPASCVP